MRLQAFISSRVVTAEGVNPAAILVEEERIRAIVPAAQIPSGAETHDFGDSAILPGLVDSHVHINDPGRAEWEGFETATRAAAAGGYTFLVDMPLNCLPATTTVDALEAKRAAARSRCWVDWAAWGGVVKGNHEDIEPLAVAGVLGFKCFLIHPGIDSFTMVDEADLRTALPHLARTGLPLLVHAELAGPVDAATKRLADSDWKSYATYLQSRPDEAELSAIRMLLALCRQYKFHLHIVHLSTSQALPELRAARSEGLKVTVETCPHYLHLAAEDIPDAATLCKCAPPIRSRENREALWQGLREGIIDLVVTDHSPCPPAMKRLDAGRLQRRVGRHLKSFCGAFRDVDRGSPARIFVARSWPMDGGGSGAVGRLPGPQRSHCRRLRCGPGCIRSRRNFYIDARAIALPASAIALSGRNSAWSSESHIFARAVSVCERRISRRAGRKGIRRRAAAIAPEPQMR